LGERRTADDPVDDHLEVGVSVVIPVYNSVDTLADCVDRVAEVLTPRGVAHEFVLVDDGSADRSWEIISELAATHDNLRGLRLSKNFGQHNALLCGIRTARYDTVVTLDDDLQHPPEEIPRLLDALTPGVDVVYGVPNQEQHGAARDAASRLSKLVLQRVMGVPHARDVSAYRAFRTRLRDAFAHYSGTTVSIDVLLTWGTQRFTAIEVEHRPRAAGRSGYTTRKLLTHALNMVTGYTTLPLRLAALVGFAFTLVGFGLFVYVLVNYAIRGGQVPGFAFIASAVTVFSGVQLFALGVIGEYLARMHYRLMERPTYVVADVT
jgi:undecaprenyl-phosphate 4-deoxy-4-formamido-L-arabinose transferase